MLSDPIVDEIKRYREEYAARLNHDLAAIVEDVRQRYSSDKQDLVCREPRHVQTTTASEEK